MSSDGNGPVVTKTATAESLVQVRPLYWLRAVDVWRFLRPYIRTLFRKKKLQLWPVAQPRGTSIGVELTLRVRERMIKPQRQRGPRIIRPNTESPTDARTSGIVKLTGAKLQVKQRRKKTSAAFAEHQHTNPVLKPQPTNRVDSTLHIHSGDHSQNYN